MRRDSSLATSHQQSKLTARLKKRRVAPNPRRVKMHRAYTVDEIAELFGMHRNTVRNWIGSGLTTVDVRRPILILGRHLREFLARRRAANRRPCGPGEIYCVRCRTPRRPAGEMADYRPLTEGSGNLTGICPTCESLMFRRVSLAKLDHMRGEVDVTIMQALRRIDESAQPSVNSDFA